MEPIEITALDGLALLPDGLKQVRIRIESGKIASVVETDIVDSTGQIIFPGFIDLHVHAREYFQANKDDPTSQAVWNAMTAKETFATAGAAAINGGVTLFVAMPNDPEPPDCESSYARKQELSLTSVCPVEVAAAVTSGSEPWDDLLYKVYLDPKPSPVSFQRWGDLRTVVARYARCRLMFHAEDPEFIASQTESGPRWRTRPPDAEFRAVDRILDLTAKFGLRAHICHISTRKAVELIEDYNRYSSLKVTSEATPHHLFFSVSPKGVVGAMGEPEAQELFECNPPLRSEDDRLFLLESLRSGSVDCLASDHAPHTIEDKHNGAPGVPHLDTYGPFVGWLMHHCGFTPQRVAEITSTAPARILPPHWQERLGAIQEGYSGTFTILDMNHPSRMEGAQIVGRGELRSRCKWSPFSGFTFPAMVRRTIVAGKCYQFGDEA